ncbi:hypothetical protein SOASR032_16140 [Pragia fontium]|uniref:Tape measure protein N-terminal domain-containing protein n=1 Tax=Pragia fontium TaxID=82985 RepID=A0ABQ5LHG2_9GAMM|nr:tape measure protein [Pragia fontium]GKX63045.1 hypothetical protein SOASR032_16140 [Pragia fontium]
MTIANMSLQKEILKTLALNQLLESDTRIYINLLKVQKAVLGGIQKAFQEVAKDTHDGLNKAGGQLSQLISDMKKGLSGLKSRLAGSNIAEGFLEGLRQAGQGVTKSFKLIGRGISGTVNTFANGWRKIPELLGKIPIKSFAEQAQGMQTLQKRISGLPQQFCDSAEGLAYLSRQANRARMPIASYGEAYISLAKSTESFIKSPLEVSNALNSMSNALTLGTGNTEEQQAALTALAQGFKQGALDSGELSGFLNLLAEKDLRQLEQALGGSSGSLLAMAEQGKITGARLIEGLKQVAPEWQKQVNGMPLTIGQATDKISNRWQTFLFKLENKTGIISKVTNFIFKAFKFVEEQIDSFIEKNGGAKAVLDKFVALCVKGFGYINKVISWFVKYCGGAKQALVTLGVVLGGLGIAAFVSALMPILIPLGLIIAALLVVGAVVKDVFAWMDGEQSVLGDMFGPWSECAPKLTAAWETFSTKMVAVWNTVKNIVSSVWGYCSQIINKMAPHFSLMWDGVKDVFNGAIDILSGIWDIIVGIFTVDSDLVISGFTSLFSGILQVVVGLINGITGLVNAMWTGIQEIFISIINSVTSIIKGWAAKIPGATKWLGDDFGKAIPQGKPATISPVSMEGLSNMGNSVAGITPAATAGVSSKIVNSQSTSNNQINVTVPAGSNDQLAQMIAKMVHNSMMDINASLGKDLVRSLP